MAGGNEKTLAEVVRRGVEKGIADLRVAVPAKVTRVDLSKGLVDAKPLLRDFFEVRGERRSVPVDVICDVPIQFPGAGGFRVTFPVVVGDECFLLFADRSLDVWLSKGGEVDPGDPRRHALSDAVALFGIHSIPNATPNAIADGMSLGKGRDGCRMRITENAVALGDDVDGPGVGRVGDSIDLTPEVLTWLAGLAAAIGYSTPFPADGVTTHAGTITTGSESVKA